MLIALSPGRRSNKRTTSSADTGSHSASTGIYNHASGGSLQGDGFGALCASHGRDGTARIRPIGNPQSAGLSEDRWKKVPTKPPQAIEGAEKVAVMY
jgi:hypothetical protein